jgi:phospholipid/cholesterol/gamma-HCH transport system ATP-binding protein
MELRRTVLEFERVTIPASAAYDAPIRNVSFRLEEGQLLLIRVDEASDHLPLADAAQGLIVPPSGAVRFLGEEWWKMGARRESLMRGKTRRIFENEGWVSNLDVVENILLSEYHHTHRSVDELMAEALSLAKAFGLSGIPPGRHVQLHAAMLRKLDWVRVFMGRPELILLDRAALGISRPDIALLIGAVREALRRGTAVVWITLEGCVWNHPLLADAVQYAMRGDEMVSLPAESSADPLKK